MAFITILLPIFFVLGIGYFCRKNFSIRYFYVFLLAFYIIVSFLVFGIFLIKNRLPFLIFILPLICLVFVPSLLSLLVSFPVSRKYSENERCGLVLSCGFTR